MHDILIALGSNVHSDNIMFVESCLVQDFYEVQSTAIVATDPIGAEFQGKLFYNAVVSCLTNLDKDDVINCLKHIFRFRNQMHNRLVIIFHTLFSFQVLNRRS